MAINDSNFPKNTAIDSITTERIKAFVHICLIQDENSPAKRYSKFNDRDYATYLTTKPLFNKNLTTFINKNILPESIFQWIVESHYQYCWIKKISGIVDVSEYDTGHMKKRGQTTDLIIRIPLDLPIKSCSIAILDYLHFFSLNATPKPIIDPLNKIKELGELWRIQNKNDKAFEWIENNDTESKINFFRDWLSTKISTNYPTTSSINTHEQLLIYFLKSGFSELEKQALSANARKIWNQKKTRESKKDSKQYNFILNNETVQKLDKLSKKYDLSRSEIIDSIIDSEFEKKIYIEEKLNRRKQIKTPLSDQNS